MQIPSAWQAAKEAFRFGWTQFGQIFKCALVPILASFAVEMVIQCGRIETGLDVLMVIYLLALVFFVSIQYTIKISRLFSLNETPNSMFSLEEMFTRRAGRYVLYVLLLNLIGLLPTGLLFALPLGLASLTKIKALALVGLVLAFFVFVYIMLGLSFVIPGVLLDVPVGLKKSFALTRGVKLKLLGAIILTALPVIVAELAALVPVFVMAIRKVPPSHLALGATGLVITAILELGRMVSLLPILALFKAKAMAQAPEPAPAVQTP